MLACASELLIAGKVIILEAAALAFVIAILDPFAGDSATDNVEQRIETISVETTEALVAAAVAAEMERRLRS